VLLPRDVQQVGVDNFKSPSVLRRFQAQLAIELFHQRLHVIHALLVIALRSCPMRLQGLTFRMSLGSGTRASVLIDGGAVGIDTGIDIGGI